MFYNILLDAFVYNFTPLYSYFFLTNIKSCSIKELIVSLILLFFLTNNIFLSIYVLIMYIINKQIKLNIRKFKNNIFINLLNYFLFVIIFSYLFHKSFLNILLLSLPINLIYFLLSYIFLYRNIYLNR